jgi:hypothetical protein
MKRTCAAALAFLLGIALLVPAATAQDEPKAAEVTQLELADILVNVMGLSRILPADPTPQEKFAALMTNGVVPQDGWQADAVVTRATLARVVVQAMGRADEIADPDDPNAWVAFLKENGIPIDTIGQAADSIEPAAEPVADYVFKRSASSDPLVRQTAFGKPDERQFGADVDASVPPTTVVVPLEAVQAVIAAAARPPRRVSPTTPDGGDA